ncbi:MAG: radical SAM protein [Anaerolineae bacterium]|jgi:radical SAM superfamily enzyme YgiQ (UPF0313 family)
MSWQQVAAVNRYLDAERGTIHKDWGGRLPIALVFPNTYYVGMSSLAVHSLYGLWNARDDIVCERVFVDPETLPISLESAAPLDYFPVLAFSISFEVDYFNVVDMLHSAGIPPRAADRDDSHPLIIAGGPAVTANPEPLAPLLDAVIIGEVEPIFDELTSALHVIAEGREAALDALATVPGLYLPQASDADPPGRIRRQWLQDLDSVPTHSVIFTPDTEFGDMGLIEIARGCGRGCRFCLAGYTYRPPRQRSIDSILAQARELLAFEDRLGLVSAAVSDHSEIDLLATELRALGARISVSSMRVDPVSEPLLRALAASGTQTLTIAPEAGSERMRRAINKTQTEDDVLRAVELADRYGFAQLKLYFMLGLPGEEDADVQAIIDLALACTGRFSRQVTVNVTPFVPKSHTPFQRLAQTPAKEVKRRLSRVERGLRKHGVGVKAESPAWAEIQGTLARGDRRIAEVLLRVERPSPAKWRAALEAAGLSLPELLGERPAGEPLPWAFIHTGAHPDLASP